MHLSTLFCWLLLCAIASVLEGSPAASQLCNQENDIVIEQAAAKTWPKEIIPYEISNQLSGVLRMRLLSTMQAQEKSSCTVFTPHSSESDFVSFKNGDRCCSNNGYIGHGRQDVLLGKPCTDSGSEQQLSKIIHMLVGGNHKESVVPLPGLNNTVKRQASEESQSFSANINKKCNAICGGYAFLDPVVDQTENLLATPNYPQHYSTHLDCTWKLVAPEGHALKLDFRDLDLEAHHSCKHDYLDVQYLDDNGRLLRSSKLCGSPDVQTLNQPTSYDVNISMAILKFHSDSSYGGKGLLLGYTTKERSVNTVDPCSIDNGGCVHVCTSDAFGEHVCSCKPGYRLTRKGKCLDINECKVNNGGCEHKCTNTQGSFSCYCKIGHILSTDQISCYTCNLTFMDRSGTIYPTGYPIYAHSQNCLWSLKSWPGHHLKITISHFDTIPSERCSEDYLKIEPSNFPYQGRLCGFHSHIEYYMQGTIKLRFRSKRTNSWHSGFSLSYKQTLSSQLDDNALHNIYVDGKNISYRQRVWS